MINIRDTPQGSNSGWEQKLLAGFAVLQGITNHHDSNSPDVFQVTMSRYLTRRYAAVTWIEALRLALLDQTLIKEIRCFPEVELVHRTEWWAWWSDEVLTVAIGLPEELQPQGLTPDAVELIDDVFLSDCLQPQCGWLVLSQVKRILERVRFMRNDSMIQSVTWEGLRIEFCDGQQGILYRSWAGHEEGYWCDIATQLPEGLDVL